MSEAGTDRSGVIAPPPLIYGGCLALALGLDWLWPLGIGPGGLAAPLQYGLGAALFAAGGVIVGIAMRQFAQAGTNVQTWKTTTALVTTGVYRWSRNPIYVALGLAYLGLGVAIDTGWALLLAPPLLIVVRHGVIAREERYLAAKFGARYRDYQAQVRRWL